jgi:acid phosphatase
MLWALLLQMSLTARGAQTRPPFQKVMIVIFENTDYEHALAKPFFGKLAKEGALLTGYYGVAHPSQPNYVAMVAGDTLDIDSDSNIDLDAVNLADRLDAKKKTWKIYADDYPGGCFLKARSGKYARKHVPLLSFTDVTGDPARCANIVDSSQLAADAKAGALPDFSMYIPNLNHDGHDTGPEFADKWYAQTFGPLIEDPAFMRGLLIVTTFDEDEDAGGDNRVYTSLYGAGVLRGAVSAIRYDHYSLTRLIEDAFGLSTLGRKDATASPIEDVWQTAR